ncbi:MAG: hypothetical protein U9R42_07160 [Bacteroidota bacterium]|nr:hypothetical protein [Bacteroidota bacterium]
MFNDFFFNFIKVLIPVGIILFLLNLIFMKAKKDDAINEEEEENIEP